ncbi:hypothetical protein Tcur_1218 [Thermomonospora curvata DSM 43183]|uniref:Uncharacterized protein n=1 Tax=Thermomonospora curvata (strain ATCC 19995 / DSM 43183 / JCM 3096 / KCTC 9072 / NBRC 15933 / NCIMB 10081 / Henssen B9) TaxID=471852 RepID=D1A9A5_THECD|nr:hypothetical protein Tcur_1218 [Thermomonospora curvata DSM 43183]
MTPLCRLPRLGVPRPFKGASTVLTRQIGGFVLPGLPDEDGRGAIGPGRPPSPCPLDARPSPKPLTIERLRLTGG